ncbi:minor capsid protein [Microviridae sp.]|nr:minor capsid protein [Microviridae sp.]UOF82359.1 minor capsid protein [Microviridae sp.]
MGLMEQAAGQALGAGLGMLTADFYDRRQIKQQQKLTDMQAKAQREQMNYQQSLAYDMWEKTNYSAQIDQLKKAGLNVGLMYKGSGSGGQLSNPSANISGGQSPVGGGEIGMGMQMGLQNAMMQAQIDNMKADTEKKKVEAGKIGGVDTEEAKTRIASLVQSVTNAQTQNELMEYDKVMKSIQNKYASESMEASINQMKVATSKVIEDTIGQAQQNKITSETMDEVVKGVQLNLISQSLMNELTREKVITQVAITEETWAKINKISEEITRMQAQTSQGEKALSQADQRIILDQIANEFNYGDHAQIIRWINAIGGAVGEVAGIVMKGKNLNLNKQKFKEGIDQFERKQMGW